jgi:hypothetical protein
MKTENIQLEQDEMILLQVRKHWFILSLQILSVVILAFLPFVLFFFIDHYVELAVFGKINTGVCVALYTAWLLFMWMALFAVWTNYYLDVWTITNKRLIAVDQKGFFSRSTASFRLERLQDIMINVNGIVATLLNYGSIELQTAGVEQNFKVMGLPDPAHIKATILSSADTLLQHATKSGL